MLRVLLLVLAAAALAGCETTGTGRPTEAAKPPEPPMTHTRAAEQCWMSTEKGDAGLSLDKRADLVDKCIEQKMKAAPAARAAPAAPSEAKKKKPMPPPRPRRRNPRPPLPTEKDEKDKKPADADAPEKKP